MITVTVERTRGTATTPMRVSAPSIERALVLAGAAEPATRVKVVFPIDPEAFFAPAAKEEGIAYDAMTVEGVEEAEEAGLPGAHEAWLDLVKDDLGDEAFETYALENGLA